MDQAQALRDILNKRKDSAVQVITVTSAKGGVGKSSVSVNLALALANRGKRVLIVDMDIGLANIDLMMGVKTKHNLSDLMSGACSVTEVIEQSMYGVQLISGGSGLTELLKITPQQVHRMISNLLNLRDVADIIIFDTASGIDEHIVRLVCASHVTWLVTTPEPTSIMDAYAMVKQVNNEKVHPQIQLILNKAESEREARAAMAGFIQIAQKYTEVNVSQLGYIMRDQHMVTAIKRQEPLLIGFPDSIAAHNIERLADRFLQRGMDEKRGLTGFFERLFGKSING